MADILNDNTDENFKDDLYEDDDHILNESEDDQDDIIVGSSNEAVKESNLLDNIFSTEDFLYDLEKTMQGFTKLDNTWRYTGRPVARTVFITMTINSLRSIICSKFIISAKTAEDIKFILLEKAKQFTFSVYDEESIDEEDTEAILNIHDHALELFMGIIEGGRGNSTLRQISANIFHPEDKGGVKKDGIGLGWDGNNLIKVGGKL